MTERVQIHFPLMPLTPHATMWVDADREEEVLEALEILEAQSYERWEAILRAERAGVVHKRA